jgi:hypothetical protein
MKTGRCGAPFSLQQSVALIEPCKKVVMWLDEG